MRTREFLNKELKIYVLQNKKTKKIVAQFDYNYSPVKLKYTDVGLPPYVWSEDDFKHYTKEDIARTKCIDLRNFEFKLIDLTFQDKWNELKEWVSFTQPKNIHDEFINGVCSAYSNVKDKMQELEKGEKDGKNNII